MRIFIVCRICRQTPTLETGWMDVMDGVGMTLVDSNRENATPSAQLIGVNAELLCNRLQRATALLVELDRLALVFSRKPTTLLLRHLSSLLVRTNETYRVILPNGARSV